MQAPEQIREVDAKTVLQVARPALEHTQGACPVGLGEAEDHFVVLFDHRQAKHAARKAVSQAAQRFAVKDSLGPGQVDRQKA